MPKESWRAPAFAESSHQVNVRRTEDIYTRFISLGLSAADVSLEDFTRLYANGGNLSLSLDCISENMVGRPQTKLHQAPQRCASCHLLSVVVSHMFIVVVRSTQVALRYAQSRVNSTKTSVETYRRELEERTSALSLLGMTCLISVLTRNYN
jgi:hypothetical protein